MQPRARDFIGAGLLFVVLSGLVAILFLLEATATRATEAISPFRGAWAQHIESNIRPYCRWIGSGIPIRLALGAAAVQSTQPRDLAALIFVVGLFGVLLVVTLMIGAPAR